jgi:hypothetical protein
MPIAPTHSLKAYKELHKKSLDEPDVFWREQAHKYLHVSPSLISHSFLSSPSCLITTHSHLPTYLHKIKTHKHSGSKTSTASTKDPSIRATLPGF